MDSRDQNNYAPRKNIWKTRTARMASALSTPIGAMLFGHDYRRSAKFAGLGGLIFGLWFAMYSLLLGGVFGLPNYQGRGTVVGAFTVVGLLLALGGAAYHSTRNRGVIVSWLLATAFLFAFMLHSEAAVTGISVEVAARTFWEATVVGIPVGTLGFCLGVAAHHLATRNTPSRISLLYYAVIVLGSVLVAGLMVTSCDLVFGGRCFAATLA